jgi:hypothetical protein
MNFLRQFFKRNMIEENVSMDLAWGCGCKKPHTITFDTDVVLPNWLGRLCFKRQHNDLNEKQI